MTKPAEPNFPAVFTDNQEDLRPFDRDLIQVLGTWALNLLAILDAGISLTDNMDVAVVSYTSNAAPDTEDTVAHTLGKVPTHYIVTSVDKAAVVYVSGTAFTKTNLYLKTNVASVAVKLIVI